MRNPTPRREYASLLEQGDYWRRFSAGADYPTIREGDKFWDIAGCHLLEVHDVGVRVGNGVTQYAETREEALEDVDPEDIWVIFSSDHPGRDGTVERKLEDVTDELGETLMAHSGNGWVPDQLAR